MKNVPVRLSDKVATLLRTAVKTSGSYNPKDCMFIIEEELTFKQSNQAEAFLTWVHENNKMFGHNILEIYAEFAANGADVYNRIVDEYSQQDENDKEFDVSNFEVTIRETPPPTSR